MIIGKLLTWKLVGAIVLVSAVYVGSLHLRLSWARSDAREAEAAEKLARAANDSNMETIATLMAANKMLAEMVKFDEKIQEHLHEQADKARKEAERARGELARLRERDREAPDCAALLDRSLAVCPDLVRRLWPPDNQNGGR